MLIYFLNFQSFFVTLVMAAANVLTCNYLGSSSMVAFNFCHRLRLKMSRALTTLPRTSQRVTPMTYQCLQRRAQQSHLKKKRKQKTPRHFFRLLRLCSRMSACFMVRLAHQWLQALSCREFCRVPEKVRRCSGDLATAKVSYVFWDPCVVSPRV